ncbi:two-component system, OmpR family, sensor histidine kinase CpxA [Prosthecobacter debontii]|uniref:histidine kinase n=2 Tax=Prosthecobacter debontii TaxID=48467 RepID=A0A1T4YKD0_9BACT|nr:HAMP domain-containing sensor histidine kinase [Prosthecobacter debontii]SKB02232.1 two-component system, OmpR family, sensor histidine kinase CpxA [Prosthecobacter debontii]
MRPRSPNLYMRILMWLLVNVAVLALGFALVLWWQFRDGLQGALGGIAGDRLQAIGQEMYSALSDRPRGEWDTVLKGLGTEHGVKVALLKPPDAVVMGESLEIPDKLREQLVSMTPDLQRRGRPEGPGGAGDGPDGRRPPPPQRDALEEFLFGDSLPPPPPPWERGEGPEPEQREGGGRAGMPLRMGTFLIKAGEPALYYAGIRLPPPTGWPRRNGPLMLLIASPSMTGGGLFFDTKPWLIGLFGAMGISALLWLPFVKNITGSIRASMHATEQISKGRFEVRVPETRGDELGRLSHAINQMAGQLDGLVRGQKRFLGDVAHELCGPISRMEMSLGILETRVDGADAYRLNDVRDELRQISALVDELLSFSKAALGQRLQTPEPVALHALIDGVVEVEGVPMNRVQLSVPEELQAMVVPDLLRRAIGNVLRNASLHAKDSQIEVKAARSKDTVTLTIADAGPGVPHESLPRLFEPFYRVDVARSRETGGTGLGLSIVKTCVEACDGAVSAQNRIPHGLIITFELPCA